MLTTDASALHGERLKTANPNDHDILPEIISKEPLGPAVRQDDFQWFNYREVDKFRDAQRGGARRRHRRRSTRRSDRPSPTSGDWSATKADFGEQIGLTNDWVVRIIRLVGNYAEVYDRNVGVKSKLGIPRGINQLWTNGGILYAPPIR